MIGVFLQVRLDSSRLPKKALLDLKGMTVIEHAMAALREVPAEVFALVTDQESTSALQPLAKKFGFSVFAGPKDDVLQRYTLAAEHYSVDRIIRATGDNPLVSSDLATRLMSLHETKGADFSGYLGPPLGTGVEIVNTEALFNARDEAADPYEREHVSPFVYRRPDRYLVLRPQAPAQTRFPSARVTLDTPEDYRVIKTIFDSLYKGRPIAASELVTWLKAGGWESIKENDVVEPDSLSSIRKTG